jgi:hypothetical protein
VVKGAAMPPPGPEGRGFALSAGSFVPKSMT